MDMFIEIKDQNDNKPIFKNTSFSGFVAESQSSNSKVFDDNNRPLVVSATDSDVGLNGLLKYSFVEEIIGAYFIVNEYTGEILTNIVSNFFL